MSGANHEGHKCRLETSNHSKTKSSSHPPQKPPHGRIFPMHSSFSDSQGNCFTRFCLRRLGARKACVILASAFGVLCEMFIFFTDLLRCNWYTINCAHSECMVLRIWHAHVCDGKYTHHSSFSCAGVVLPYALPPPTVIRQTVICFLSLWINSPFLKLYVNFVYINWIMQYIHFD